MSLSLKQLQEEQKSWVQHNFPNRESYMPLLGAIEEIGELSDLEPDDKHLFQLFKSLAKISHHHLKKEQKIRVSEDHDKEIADGIADCIIFLSDYSEAKGFDLQRIVEETWNKVKNRDWQRWKINGKDK